MGQSQITGRRKNRQDLSSLEPGDEFNPYDQFDGIFVPEAICKYKGLSMGAKMAYGRLVRFGGKNGKVFPSASTMGAELGVGATQARTYIRELKREMFLDIKPKAGRSSDYAFLWHQAFSGETGDLRKRPPQKTQPLRKTGEVTPAENRRGTPTENRKSTPTDNRSRRESLEESHKRESSSSGQPCTVLQPVKRTNPSFTESQNPEEGDPEFRAFDVGEALLKFFENRGTAPPAGPPPAGTIRRMIAEAGGGARELAAFLDHYSKNLDRPQVQPPMSWKHVMVSLERFIKTVELWQAKDERHTAELAEAQRQEEAERTAKEAEHERVMTTPVDLERAEEILLKLHQATDTALEGRLRRKGVKEITPRELLARVHEYARKKCDRCNKNGIFGSAVKGTLQFCDCEFGIDRREWNPDAVSRAIADANADIKARLATAFTELNLLFTADALYQSEVIETERGIEIRAPKTMLIGLQPREIEAGRHYLGETRMIGVVTQEAA